MDLTYEILGRAALVEDMRVVMVSTVVTPRDTLAGVAVGWQSGRVRVARAREDGRDGRGGDSGQGRQEQVEKR